IFATKLSEIEESHREMREYESRESGRRGSVEGSDRRKWLEKRLPAVTSPLFWRKMSAELEGYEQDYAVLTAEITGRIGKVPRLVGDEKKLMILNVEKQLDEARELLEQMDLEVREIPVQSRSMYSNRMRSYKQEMSKLDTDFVSFVANQVVPTHRTCMRQH
ncbi:hypothetical protein XELAEV_18036634mg, partial [Xenopus laevis]